MLRNMHSDQFFAKPVFRRAVPVSSCVYAPPRRVLLQDMSERPVILTGFTFTKSTLATFSERYEIAGHMDKPDPASIPTGSCTARAGPGHHRQRRRLRRLDGGTPAAFVDLLLRHRLRAHGSRGGAAAQHHGHARRRRQCTGCGRDGDGHLSCFDPPHRPRRQDDPPRRMDQAHPQPLRRHRRPHRRQARHSGSRRHRPGVRQARQGIRSSRSATATATSAAMSTSNISPT